MKAQSIRIVKSRLGIPDEERKRRSKATNAREVILEVSSVAVSDLVPWEPNPRQGDVGFLTESLTINGQYTPLVVQSSTNRIIVGNHTFQAAQWLGWSEVSVTFIDVTDEQATKIMLMDNRASDVSDYDGESLKKTLLALDEWDGTGFSNDDVDDIFRGYSTTPASRRKRNVQVAFRQIKFAVGREVFFPWADGLPQTGAERHLASRLGIPEGACEFPDGEASTSGGSS